MKKLMIGLALTAMAASPALAAGKYHRATASEAQASDNAIVTGSTMPAGADAYAYAPDTTYMAPAPGAVFVQGEYQGADPDPLIRLQLLRDPPTHQQ